MKVWDTLTLLIFLSTATMTGYGLASLHGDHPDIEDDCQHKCLHEHKVCVESKCKDLEGDEWSRCYMACVAKHKACFCACKGEEPDC